MADYTDTVTRVAQDSEVLRVYPNALVSLYTSGTSTLVAEVAADAYGKFTISDLPRGVYDVKVNGQLQKTIHFVPGDPDKQWTFFFEGSISSDDDVVHSTPDYFTDVAGKIIQVRLVVKSTTGTSNATIHLVSGPSGASELTMAADSIWSHQVFPGDNTYRYNHVDLTPDITLAANDVVQMGVDNTVGGTNGVSIHCVFRPD
jgi:hypothetical protein